MLSALSLAALFAKLLLIGSHISPGSDASTNAPAAATIAILAILALPLAALGARARLLYGLGLNAAGTLTALADVWHVRFYGDLLSVAEIGGKWQVGMVFPSLRAIVRPFDFLLFADIVVLGAAGIFAGRMACRSIAWPTPRLVVAALAAVALVGGARVLHVVRADPDEVLEYGYQRQQVVRVVGLAGYHLYDLGVNVLYPLRGRLTRGRHDVSDVETFLRTRSGEQFRSRLSGIARGRNVIILSAESLQTFALDLTIGGEAVAPHLNAFARESLRFDEFYDQTHMGTTSDAEFVSLNSLMPLSSGAVSTRYAANDFLALPQVLRERGYDTLSACAEPRSVWNMAQIHPKLGFARSLYSPDFRWTRTVGVGLEDASFFEQLRSVFRSAREPFLAYLISSSNHHPYRIPTSLRRLDPRSVPGGMAGDYLQSVRYFDEAFGAFMSGLDRDGVLDRTVIAVFGDHQSWMDDAELQRVWSASGHSAAASPFELWRFRRKVPLLIRLPHGAEAGRRAAPGGHLDIAPTLMSLVGVEDAAGPWLGHDLTAPSRNLVVFRDASVTDGESAVVRTANGAPACYVRDGRTIPCRWTESLEAEARAVLSASDAVIEGNLAAAFAARPVGEVPARRPPGRVLVIAHRGDSIRYPENTLDAIRAAFDLGADAVEVDVRLSRDGVPMVFHDDTLERTTNGRGSFASRSLKELEALDAGGWMAPRFKGLRIPTLEEAVHAAAGRGSLLLDLKVDGLARPVRAVYERAGVKPEEALIGGWTQSQRSEFIHDMAGARVLKTDAAPLVWGPALFEQLRGDGLWGFEVGDYWPPPFLGDAALHDVPVIAYTANDESTIRRLIEAGVSGIETDDPVLTLRVAAELHAR